MDQLSLQEEVEALKKYRGHSERLLRDIGIDLRDLPDNVTTALDENANLHKLTNLVSLDDKYLQEFYYTKKDEQIEQRHMMEKLQREIADQEMQIQHEMDEIAALQSFTSSVSKRVVSDAGLDHQIDILNSKIKSMEDRQGLLNLPANLDLDGLMQNIELLKAKPKQHGKMLGRV